MVEVTGNIVRTQKEAWTQKDPNGLFIADFEEIA